MGWLLLTRNGTGEQVQIQRGGWYTVVNPRVSGVKGWSSSGRWRSPYFVKGWGRCRWGPCPKIPPSIHMPSLRALNYPMFRCLPAPSPQLCLAGLETRSAVVGGSGHRTAPPPKEGAPWEWFFQHLICWCWSRSLALHRGLQSQHILRLKVGVGGRGS